MPRDFSAAQIRQKWDWRYVSGKNKNTAQLFEELKTINCKMNSMQDNSEKQLTQTGSLVPAAQGRAGLRGPKAALLLHKVPSASLVTANTVPQQPRRYHDLTKVQCTVYRAVSAEIYINHTCSKSIVALKLQSTPKYT